MYQQLKGTLKQLHGSFMVIAWLMASSVGTLLPVYMKKTWVGKQIMGKDRWFVVNFLFSLFYLREILLIIRTVFPVSSRANVHCLEFNDCRIRDHFY